MWASGFDSGYGSLVRWNAAASRRSNSCWPSWLIWSRSSSDGTIASPLSKLCRKLGTH